jgi:hypothetical protein
MFGLLARRRDATLAVVVFAVACWAFGVAAARTPHWADENDYLITSRYFLHLFVERDLSSPEWDDNYWTHTQPMVPRYLIGAWLWWRGYDLYDMPGRYDLTNSLQENQRKGRVPEDVLLQDARAPSVLFAAGSVSLLFLLGSALAGPLAGLAAAAFALGSPFVQEHMVRAMPEAPLLFFFELTLLLALLGTRQDGTLKPSWAMGLGVALGLALASKLTAVLSLAAVLGWIGVIVVASLRSRGAGPSLATHLRPWALALAVALVVFVASDPHLYRDPLTHTIHLFEQRAKEEQARQREVPRLAVRAPLDRVGRVLNGSLVVGTFTGSRGVPLEAALAIGGAIVLSVRGWQRWREGNLGAEALTLLTATVFFAGIAANLYLDYARYYVPTVMLGALLGGVAVDALVHASRRLGARASRSGSLSGAGGTPALPGEKPARPATP